jgi:glycosyltransferase involved in cell wall biosynthesis
MKKIRLINNFINVVSIRRRLRRYGKLKDYQTIKNLVVTDANRASGLFDPEWYAAGNPDVITEGQEPFYHYLNHGHFEGRNPGPEFDTNFYKAAYPDVVVAGLNPLVHYLQSGRAEGRAPNPCALPIGNDEVRHVIVKEMGFGLGGDAAILVTHTGSGRLKPHILPYLHLLRECGLSVLLVVVVDRPLELRDAEIAGADGIIVRDNAGYDFGAWAHALQILPALFGAGLVILTNDSVVPTADVEVFRAMIDRVRNHRADIVGLTASHEYGWHVQSYFLAIKAKALASWRFQHFIRDIKRLDDKDAVIRSYEVPFAGRMQAAGLTVEALFTSSFAANPTFFGWRELIAQGFPFIKLLMLREQFAAVVGEWPDLLREVQREWPKVLHEAGFDVNLVRASLRAAEISSPAGSDTALLVDPKRFELITADHPLRVAFFGPWNYDNGLGAASRELLCALRQTNFLLNVYPVTKPFHIHRLICPAVATIDFGGRPDIAIVHLNPDSWHLLNDQQRAIIRSAKQRIGYWVWETDKLPPAWQTDLYSVDRIWAPSRYCAEVFAAVGVPVDVVPHPVRVPAQIGTDRESVLRQFDIDPSKRVILYIFDGASYLVRKNPDALIRSFAASRLAARGWTLILKTKHLYDRVDAGTALAALAAATPGVRILEISLHADEVTSLIAASDIYASPHCSEGFGLTVAEAMALGRLVVATDFGGTRDFLDANTGYPVAAMPWKLEESHGHYLAGHAWARIDERALAEVLVRAADAVAAGNLSKGQAARDNIARLLSYQAVAQAIRSSVAALIADAAAARSQSPQRKPVTVPPTAPRIAIDLSGAAKFRELARDHDVIPVQLAGDLSWPGNLLPDGGPNDWLFFAPREARVCPGAINIILDAASHRPDVALFYADDVAAGETTSEALRLKPDFDRTLIIAQDYIGAPVIVRRKTLEAVGGLNPGAGSALLYDLVLRVADSSGTIGRISRVLIGHEREHPVANVAERRRVLESRNKSDGLDIIAGAAPGLLSQRRRFAKDQYPAITIAIPTCRTLRPGLRETFVERLLAGIAKADWPMDRVTVIVGDDVVGEPDWAARAWPFHLRRLETPRRGGEAFNYAAKMNRLWRECTDELIVFMNDDLAPQGTGWLAALVGFACDESVGGVGGRLYYEDGSIQHAGIFPSLRTVVHAWLGWPAAARTYQDWALTQREWSMITGAVFATRRAILDQVGGFDERFSLEFNDIDLCLRLRSLGYRIVYNPLAEFTHAEKASRGETIPPGAEVALFLSRWAHWLDHDPASHPGLAKDRLELVPSVDPGAWYLRR